MSQVTNAVSICIEGQFDVINFREDLILPIFLTRKINSSQKCILEFQRTKLSSVSEYQLFSNMICKLYNYTFSFRKYFSIKLLELVTFRPHNTPVNILNIHHVKIRPNLRSTLLIKNIDANRLNWTEYQRKHLCVQKRKTENVD